MQEEKVHGKLITRRLEEYESIDKLAYVTGYCNNIIVDYGTI